MSAGAIVMMLVAILILWGGLALAIYNLTQRDPGDRGGAHRDL